MGLTSRFYLTVAVTVVGASFQFYSYAVLNTTQTGLESWINSSYAGRGVGGGSGLSEAGLTVFWSFTVSILAVGGLLGSLLTHWLAERFGRRGGLLVNGAVNVVGGVFEALAKPAAAPELLMLGRLVLGFNIGVSCGLAPLYLTEIAPVGVRGAVGTSHQVAAAFGDWFCIALSLPQLLGGETLWPVALAFPALPAALLCALLPFCPESPRYLMVKKGDRRRAFDAALALVGTKAEAQALVDDLETEIEASVRARRDRSWGDWHRRPELYRPLAIVVVVMIAQQFTGIAAVLSFSSDIFQEAGLTLETAQFATVGVGVCYFVCTVPALWLIERLGRRCLSLFQLIGCLLTMSLLALFIGGSGEHGWAAYATIAVLGLYMCIYGVGSPVPWLIASELFAQEYRSTAVSVGTFTSFSVSFLVATFYLPLQELVGAAWSFVPFIVVLALCIAFLALRLPETQGRHIQDIVRSFGDEAEYRPIGEEDAVRRSREWLESSSTKLLGPLPRPNGRLYDTFTSTSHSDSTDLY